MTEDDIFAFIRSSIPSVWALELLLLLRHDPNRCWRPDEIVQELRSSTVAIRDSIAGLRNAGMIAEENGAYCLCAASPDIEQTADAIARLYAVKPAAVVKAIVTAPNDRLRIFANSFKLKD